MRKVTLSFPVLLILISVSFAPAAVLPTQAAFKPGTDTAHYGMYHSYDVLKYTLVLDLYANFSSPYSRYFNAKEIISFKVDSTLSKIFLNAVATSLVIDSVGMAANSFTTSGDTLFIQLNRFYNPGEVAQIRICYHHLNVVDHAFYNSTGTIFTDFPPEGARKVFPCWDRPSDKALTDITVKVPVAVRLGSNGSLADSVISGDTLTYHWTSRDPIATYLITLTSKTTFLVDQFQYHLYGNPTDSIPVRLYYKQNEDITLPKNLVGPLTDYYASLFGDYPFEKIGFATLNAAFPWGGMENQTMVNLMPGGFSEEDVIAHEHSHQWFGDLITCGTWADIWLNEGFGTFCESLWREHASGYPAYLNKINGLAGVYFAQNPHLPIYNPSWAMHTPASGLLYNSALIYDKGACVLHQLRVLLGDSLFFNVMSAYSSDTNFRFKNAVTADFIAKVNEVTGQDYQWYFNEWVYQRDHPVYHNTFEILEESVGNWLLKFRIEQIQTNTGLFRMPVDIKVVFENGSDSVLTVDNNLQNQVFEFNFPLKPLNAVFDPDEKIILKEAITVLGIPENDKTAGGIELFQNHPNPFGKSTEIEFSVDTPREVTLSVLNSEGKVIQTPVNTKVQAGKHSATIHSSDLKPGVYYYRLTSGKFEATRKMIFLK